MGSRWLICRVFFRFAIASGVRVFAPVAICILAVPFLLFGQGLTPREASLLARETQQVSGTVSNSAGVPISGAAIQHLGRLNSEVITDSNGHFEFSTRVPAFVIWKVGYGGALVRTDDAHAIQVTLQRSDAEIPACSSKSVCASAGWGTVFCFAKINGVTISKQINDIDYGERIYSIRLEHERQTMTHGGGPMWGAGLPFDEDVWSSVEYSEKSYRYGAGVIVDAKGKSASGKFWRSIGRFGETATYRDVGQESAALFDRLLDGICIQQEKRQ